jgi:hypothetical protein
MFPNIREQWKKGMEKAIIAMRENKLGTLKVFQSASYYIADFG